MDFNRNLRIVRTSGSSYPFPYRSNVLWVHHDENNNPVVEIWDHGKWVPVTGVGSGSGDIIIDTKMSDSSSNAIANKTVKKYIDGIASKTDASILSLNEGKVDKEQGKGLSTNDYTDIDKAKLDKMPTKVSDLENDSNYATDQDLVNLATKDEVKKLEDKIDNIQPGTEITVDTDLNAESTNPVQNKAIAAAMTELQDYCFPTSLEASISPSSVEWTGSSVEVSVHFRVLRNSKPVVADIIQIQFNGETKTLENVAEGSEKFTLSTQGYKSGSVTAKKGSTTIKNSPRSVSANLYLPVYYGFSKATTGNELTITSLTKGGSSLNGTKTLTNDDTTKYLWLCVPNTMSINKVTSSGFDVPFLAPVEASTPLGTYKCYRTQDLPGAGSMTIVIS
jgi:hypothetical protein